MEPTTQEADPQVETPVLAPETEPEQTSEPVKENEQDANDEAVESETETAPAPTKEEDEEAPFPLQQSNAEVTPFTVEDLKTDAEGNVDLAALMDSFNQRLNQVQQGTVSQTQQMVEVRDRYKSEWDKAEAKYPELKDNQQLKEIVYARHADALERQGKWKSPLKAADEIISLIKGAETKGIETAQKNVEVQKSASLETSSSSSAPSSTVSSDMQARLNSTDPTVASAARREVIAQRIRDGKL